MANGTVIQFPKTGLERFKRSRLTSESINYIFYEMFNFQLLSSSEQNLILKKRNLKVLFNRSEEFCYLYAAMTYVDDSEIDQNKTSCLNESITDEKLHLALRSIFGCYLKNCTAVFTLLKGEELIHVLEVLTYGESVN